ncbi:MAG TPA: D-Ala-D-Ala carboxypeptidase family metallohydrolase [Alphaproteobacteria bacterium]|nr:D-Ala-D-Ala carboxypeptidase family metallohydrolase [Alphaproteobacteria bacterium]
MTRKALRYRHWKKVPLRWFRARWPNFHPREIACRHCGEVVIDVASMDTLQRQRTQTGEPIVVNSAYRCPIHNAMVGGAPLSMHKFGRAFDQALRGRDRGTLEAIALHHGFTGIGRYRTFLHTDTGRRRTWGS